MKIFVKIHTINFVIIVLLYCRRKLHFDMATVEITPKLYLVVL